MTNSMLRFSLAILLLLSQASVCAHSADPKVNAGVLSGVDENCILAIATDGGGELKIQLKYIVIKKDMGKQAKALVETMSGQKVFMVSSSISNDKLSWKCIVVVGDREGPSIQEMLLSTGIAKLEIGDGAVPDKWKVIFDEAVAISDRKR